LIWLLAEKARLYGGLFLARDSALAAWVAEMAAALGITWSWLAAAKPRQ